MGSTKRRIKRPVIYQIYVYYDRSCGGISRQESWRIESLFTQADKEDLTTNVYSFRSMFTWALVSLGLPFTLAEKCERTAKRSEEPDGDASIPRKATVMLYPFLH